MNIHRREDVHLTHKAEVKMKIASLIVCFFLCVQIYAMAADCAGQISADRRAHGLSAVTVDSRLNAVALQQARAMASSGTISPHRVFWAMVISD
jgi:hypothetical protein